MPTLDGKDVRIVANDSCTLCGQCVAVCPCEYLSISDGKVVEKANASMGCIACGQCAAVCPAGAIRGTHFSDEQIMAQIEGVLLRNAGNGHALREQPEPGAAQEAVYG